MLTSAGGDRCDEQNDGHQAKHTDDVRTGPHRDVTTTPYAAADDDDDDVNNRFLGNSVVRRHAS